MIVVLEGGFCKENSVELMGKSWKVCISICCTVLYNSNL